MVGDFGSLLFNLCVGWSPLMNHWQSDQDVKGVGQVGRNRSVQIKERR